MNEQMRFEACYMWSKKLMDCNALNQEPAAPVVHGSAQDTHGVKPTGSAAVVGKGAVFIEVLGLSGKKQDD